MNRPALLGAATVAALLAACSPCTDRGVNLGAACTATSLANDTKVTFEVREACGTSCAQPPQCTVRVDGTILTVIVGQVECSDCVANGACQQRKATCELPELVSGTYTLVLPGLPSQTLTVASGGQATCTLDG